MNAVLHRPKLTSGISSSSSEAAGDLKANNKTYTTPVIFHSIYVYATVKMFIIHIVYFCCYIFHIFLQWLSVGSRREIGKTFQKFKRTKCCNHNTTKPSYELRIDNDSRLTRELAETYIKS